MRQVVDAPLSVEQHVAAVDDPRAGAVATFVGRVRDHDPSVTGRVVALEYSAHPNAAAVLADVVGRVAGRPDVLAVAASHRVGRLEVGEVAIVVTVATAHRALAFDVCRELVETLKAELPIWKREVLADGSHVWVGM
nr:molybdenum cofactor biosynthesis protein MoaE [Cellulomonas aerilata]